MFIKYDNRLENIITYRIRWELMSLWVREWRSYIFYIFLEDIEDIDLCGLIERIWLNIVYIIL